MLWALQTMPQIISNTRVIFPKNLKPFGGVLPHKAPWGPNKNHLRSLPRGPLRERRRILEEPP